MIRPKLTDDEIHQILLILDSGKTEIEEYFKQAVKDCRYTDAHIAWTKLLYLHSGCEKLIEMGLRKGRKARWKSVMK